MSINGRILFTQMDIRLRLVAKHKYVVYQIKRAITSYRAPDMDGIVIVINISALIQKCIYKSRLFFYMMTLLLLTVGSSNRHSWANC